MAKFTCPFCIREYDKRDVLYACPSCGAITTRGRFEREPIKCKTPGCSSLATIRICPCCGQTIPKMVLETPYFPLSIVGASNSGKTSYITVMLHELGLSFDLDLALGYQTRETMDYQNENYHRIYNEHSTPWDVYFEDPLFQIWYIINLRKKHGSKVPAYTFSVFDGAGDALATMDEMLTVSRYIAASKAIILTINPLDLPKVRNSGIVDHDVLVNSSAAYTGESKNAEDIINSAASYIKAAKGIKATKVLNIPVAVVLTKFDTILNHKSFDPQAIIRKKSLPVRNGCVDTTEITQVDEEIRNWLHEIGEDVLIDILDANFKEYCFFGVSSYGNPPVTACNLPDDISPHRVLDPILWLFKKAKVID